MHCNLKTINLSETSLDQRVVALPEEELEFGMGRGMLPPFGAVDALFHDHREPRHFTRPFPLLAFCRRKLSITSYSAK
jgi:hypothetical protein